MSKKSRRDTWSHRKSSAVEPRIQIQPQKLLEIMSQVEQRMIKGDFTGTIQVCKHLQSMLPRRSPARVEILALLGLSHAMLQQYQESYDIFGEALTIDPLNAELWYNHGLACRYTSRVGQAVRDLEQAVELSKNTPGGMANKCMEELETSRGEVAEGMAIYQGQITLDQYIKLEDLFKQCMTLMTAHRWAEAEQKFRELIQMGGRLPQYWGNLGVSLIMQSRYDEAETALKHALSIDPGYPVARDNLAKLPEIRRSKIQAEVVPLNLNPVEEITQSLTFYEPSEDRSSMIPRVVIEQSGNILTSTGQQLGKQSPHYSFFLNPYKDVRFTTCPKCHIKTRLFKSSLVIRAKPHHLFTVGKMCRYCAHCDLLIVHRDQLEAQLVKVMARLQPESIGYDYMILGTLNRLEWRQDVQDVLSEQEMIEQLHDFKEVITFKPVGL